MSLEPMNAAITRRPALPAAVLFVIGIAFHRLLPRWPVIWLIILPVLLIVALFFLRRSILSNACIAAAVIFAGLCSGQMAAFDFSSNDIGQFTRDEPQLAWVEGSITQTPRLIEAEPGGRPLPAKQTIHLRVSSVKLWSGWSPANGDLPVSISPPVEGIEGGQTVRILGRLERPEPAMNPGEFDAAQQDRRERILATMHVSRPYDVQIVSNSSIASPLIRMRDFTRGWLDRGFDRDHAADRAVLAAMVFADHEPALRPTQDDFTHTGTNHLLASNGARVAILAAALYLLCRLLRLSPRITVSAVAAAVSLWGFITMPAAEALRPAGVCAAVGFALIGGRQSDPIQMLAVIALALLIPRPLELYGAGFQLSFVIVLGMMVFTPPLTRWIGTFRNPDRAVAESFVEPTRWQRLRRWFGVWMLRATVGGAVAWAMAVPLVAYHFEQFTPWTIPFGILLAPFALLALCGGFLKILLTALCPPQAGTWATTTGFTAAMLRHAVHALAHVPGSDLPLSRPAVGWILLYYALMALPLIPAPRRTFRRCVRCGPAAAGVLALTPLCLGSVSLHPNAPALRITLLSVGAGQCAVLEPSSGGVVLIDAGSSTLSDPARTSIEPFLRHQQERSIDSIFLSHGDYDHISATRDLVPEHSVRQVLVSPSFRRHAHESQPCEKLLESLDQSDHSPRLISQGDRIELSHDVSVQVLWPPPDSTMNSNNAGLVLRVTCAGKSILFPADIQEPAERELLKHPELLRSDILVAPHHGSAETTTPAFVAAVNPQIIVASSASHLTKKQRTFDSRENSFPIDRTGRFGAITIEIARDGTIHVEHFLRR